MAEVFGGDYPVFMDTRPPFPKPHLWHQACAAVSILCSLLLAGVFISGLAIADACSVISAIILTPLPTAVAIVQYLGTFRQSPAAAAWAFAATVFCAVIALWAVLTISNDMRGTESAVLTALASFALTSTIALTNGHWWRKLRRCVSAGSNPDARRGFSLQELLLVVSAVSLVAGVSAFLASQAKPITGQHVAAEDAPFDLPEGASDVTYKRRSYFFECEFTCTEQAFLKWFDGRAVESKYPGHHLQEHHNGWGFYWREQDRHERIEFDREQARVFWSWSSR